MKLKTADFAPRNGNRISDFSFDEIGDDHFYTGLETPMRPDAFEMSDLEKKDKISDLFAQIMDVMGLDLTDDSLKGTPNRVAKMYIEEIFSGLNPANKPKIKANLIFVFSLSVIISPYLFKSGNRFSCTSSPVNAPISTTYILSVSALILSISAFSLGSI